MKKTALGLFPKGVDIGAVVREIEALGFSRNEIQTAEEPASPQVTGVMSFPRLEYEVELGRALNRMGASRQEIEAYIDGIRRGGAVVFATDEDEKKVNAAGDVMEQWGAQEIEATVSAAPNLPASQYPSVTSVTQNRPVQSGRVRQSNGGARFFVW